MSAQISVSIVSTRRQDVSNASRWLSDIGLPGIDGISGIAILKQRYPDLVILMLTVYDDTERIFDALCAGACHRKSRVA